MRHMRSGSSLLLPIAIGLAACDAPPAAPSVAAPAGDATVEEGHASYYSRRFTGRRMASGERLNPDSNVAAHRTLPFGTVVRVTNLQNGRTEIVRIADRGPHMRGRILDVTPRVAERLGMRAAGVVPVSVTPVGLEEYAEATDQPRRGARAD